MRWPAASLGLAAVELHRLSGAWSPDRAICRAGPPGPATKSGMVVRPTRSRVTGSLEKWPSPTESGLQARSSLSSSVLPLAQRLGRSTLYV